MSSAYTVRIPNRCRQAFHQFNDGMPRLRMSVVLLLVSIFGCEASNDRPATETLVEVTDASFQSEVIESEQVILVEFWAPWCRPCVEMIPDVEQVARNFGGRVKVARIRIDENPMTAAEYDIDAPPEVLVFQNGDVVKRRHGKQDRASLTELLTSSMD